MELCTSCYSRVLNRFRAAFNVKKKRFGLGMYPHGLEAHQGDVYT
jgi:hypothetical protein